MKDYLYQKDWYLPLGDKPHLMDENEWNLLNRKAFGVIKLTLSKSIAFNIKFEHIAKVQHK